MTANNDKHKFNKVSLSVMEESTVTKPIVVKKSLKKSSKKISHHKEEEKIGKELEEIYRNGDGTMPDMADFEQKPRHSLRRAFLILLLAFGFLGAVAWAGFFVLDSTARFQESDVILEIEGEKEVKAGGLVHYRLRYYNDQKISLTKANIKVRYPAGFVFKESSIPSINAANDEWAIGAIDSGHSGYVDIYGYLFGNINQDQSLRVFLNYFPSNFSSEFQKVATFTSKTSISPIILSVDAPNEIVTGNEVEFIINLSKPEEPVRNLAVVMEPGGNFNKISSEPASNKGKSYEWGLEEIVEEQKIKIKGTFNPNEEKAVIRFSLLAFRNDKQQESYLWQEYTLELSVLKTEMSANLAINGTMNDFSVKPGETLNTSIALKNAGDTALKNLQVRLIFETPSFNNRSLFNWQKLNDAADGEITGEQVNEQTRRGIIAWTKKHLPVLNKLEPGKEINIDLSVPLKDSADLDLTQFTSSFITAFAEIKYSNGEGEKLISTVPIKMTINSDLEFTVRDEISENSQNQDVHKVTWILNNTFHELKAVEISADLYGDIVWQEGSLLVPAGVANFDQTTKKLIWQVDLMPVSVDVLALQFAVAIRNKNPSQANLTSKVSVKAIDAVTGQEIILAGEEILLN